MLRGETQLGAIFKRPVTGEDSSDIDLRKDPAGRMSHNGRAWNGRLIELMFDCFGISKAMIAHTKLNSSSSRCTSHGTRIYL